jgi:hypothetical protein
MALWPLNFDFGFAGEDNFYLFFDYLNFVASNYSGVLHGGASKEVEEIAAFSEN